MKKVYLPYYVSRAALSILISLLTIGLNWGAALMSLLLFALFVLYLHSGWFQVDPSSPLFPLRRDTRGLLIQRTALAAAVGVGALSYLVLSRTQLLPGLAVTAGSIAAALAILVYFATQFILFIRS